MDTPDRTGGAKTLTPFSIADILKTPTATPKTTPTAAPKTTPPAACGRCGPTPQRRRRARESTDDDDDDVDDDAEVGRPSLSLSKQKKLGKTR